MKSASILCLALLECVTGCVAPRQAYVVPEGVTVARVNSGIRSPFDSGTSITVWVMDKDSCAEWNTGSRKNMRSLFSIVHSTSFPSGYVEIEAGKPMWLRYMDGDMRQFCEVMLEVTFEPGRDYTFFGGQKVAVNFLDKSGCMFGVKDQTTGQPVEVKKLTRENLCAK